MRGIMSRPVRSGYRVSWRDLRRHQATAAIDHPQRHCFAHAQIGKTGMAQHFAMQEHIARLAEQVGKAESLALSNHFTRAGRKGSVAKTSGGVSARSLIGRHPLRCPAARSTGS